MTFPLTISRPVTFFDFESTGPDPKTARIVSIGIDKLMPELDKKGEHVRKHFHTLINPGVLIPPESTKKHKITDAHVVEAPRLEGILPGLIDEWFTGVDYGGYNIKRYDIELLAAECQRCDVRWDAEGRCLDAFRIWQVLFPRTLTDAVREWLGREPTEAHSANGDATDALEVFLAMLRAHPGLPKTVEELHELQWGKPDPNQVDRKGALVSVNGRTCFNFGKHKGLPLVSQKSYAEWWASQPDRTFEQRAIVQDVLKGIRA